MTAGMRRVSSARAPRTSLLVAPNRKQTDVAASLAHWDNLRKTVAASPGRGAVIGSATPFSTCGVAPVEPTVSTTIRIRLGASRASAGFAPPPPRVRPRVGSGGLAEGLCPGASLGLVQLAPRDR